MCTFYQTMKICRGEGNHKTFAAKNSRAKEEPIAFLRGVCGFFMYKTNKFCSRILIHKQWKVTEPCGHFQHTEKTLKETVELHAHWASTFPNLPHPCYRWFPRPHPIHPKQPPELSPLEAILTSITLCKNWETGLSPTS